MGFLIFFILFELVVFAVEAVIYGILLKKFTTKKADCFKTTAYAFVANLLSFVAGLGIAIIIPGIF